MGEQLRDDLELLDEELGSRDARDYVVVARSSPVEAVTVLEQLRRESQRVAAVLASQWMEEMEGSHMLAGARALHAPREASASRRAPGPGAGGDRRRHSLRHPRAVASTGSLTAPETSTSSRMK